MTLECEQAKQMQWTPGAGKTLRALGDALMNTEYESADTDTVTRENPQLMVVDMNTGATILLKPIPHSGGKTKGDGYVRYADYEQSNPQRIPPTLKVVILLDKIAGMLGGRITSAVMREIAEAMSEANILRLSNDKATYQHWIDEHAKHPEALEEILTEFRQMTVKNQKGDTLIQMKAIPHMVATADVRVMQDIVDQYIVEQEVIENAASNE
tara:strand:+ start:9528 stop:10163 length:636 start_codon:yes stop_codon:yes gene_type:complete